MSSFERHKRIWARGSVGRAPRSHRGGRGFESLRVHHIINPQKCGFSLCLCGFSSFLVFANLAVSCGLFAYRLHRNYTVKYPLRNWRGHLFTTPSLTLRVPRTKGAFALCLRLERPHHNISAFHSLRNAGRQRRHLGQHSKSSPGAGELLGESRITFCGRGRPCQERKQP